MIVRILRALISQYNTTREQTEKREAERTEYDRITAVWTRRLGIWTIVLSVSAIVTGAIFYDQLSVSKQTARDQLRAYVGIEGIDLVAIPDGGRGEVPKANLILTLKNDGLTPAYYVFDRINFGVKNVGRRPSKDQLTKDLPAPNFPPAQSTLDGGHTVDDLHPLFDEDVQMWAAAESRQQDLYIWGRILYCDIYGVQWERPISYMYEPWLGHGHEYVEIGVAGGERTTGKCLHGIDPRGS